jgi:hypothetical protein
VDVLWPEERDRAVVVLANYFFVSAGPNDLTAFRTRY